MTNQIPVYDPTAHKLASGTPATQPAGPVHAALTSLAGKVVGIIDNAKPNFENLADALAALLTQQHGVASVRRHRKHAASLPAAAGIAADFAATCDLVITGSGD